MLNPIKNNKATTLVFAQYLVLIILLILAIIQSSATLFH